MKNKAYTKRRGATWIARMTNTNASTWHVRKSKNTDFWQYMSRDGIEEIPKRYFEYLKEIEELKEYFLSFYYQETEVEKAKYSKMLDIARSGVAFIVPRTRRVTIIECLLFPKNSEATRLSTYKKLKKIRKGIENESK